MERDQLLSMKLDHLIETMEKFIKAQEDHNRVFYRVRDLALELKTRLDTGWKVLCAVGVSSATLGAGAAWAFEHLIK